MVKGVDLYVNTVPAFSLWSYAHRSAAVGFQKVRELSTGAFIFTVRLRAGLVGLRQGVAFPNQLQSRSPVNAPVLTAARGKRIEAFAGLAEIIK